LPRHLCYNSAAVGASALEPVYQMPFACQMTKLLLASGSPRRRELLNLLGFDFEVISPSVSEVPLANERPAALVARLSQAKARAACPSSNSDAAICRNGIVIACDTVVALDGQLLGKPCDTADAVAMLRHLRERSSHVVYSAITLLAFGMGRVLTDVAETQVMMRAYTDMEIAAYVASGDPLDKAGAYAIQHADFRPVSRLQGCYANVMGLPLCHLTRCLRTWGIESPPHVSVVPQVCQAYVGYDCSVYPGILNEDCPVSSEGT
jgi:septum formation protein